ncbi:unnamed protein product [Mytilus coruscus]|uniref:Tc1-like transposase DDE domain-containing protein n=1 Tax=Mytilus coruscus TaxID=42192 RepID=A0A6J8BP54_MYTCO|nr:unnamed protein product [Mytilus coruscus]
MRFDGKKALVTDAGKGIKPTTLRRYVHTDASDDAVQDVVKAVHKAAVQKTVKKNQKLDDFDKGVVRRTIYDLHKKSQSVTMPNLQQALKKKDIDVSISTVSRTVRLLGFRFYKNVSCRRFVSEREDIVLMRMTYLRKIRKFRQQGRHIVYLDETWLNTNHVVKGDWLDVPSTSMSVFEPHSKGTHRKIPSGKGTRLIILDVGSSQQGLIPGCGLIFESKTNSSDYHDEMNKEYFTEWSRDTLLPKLPPRSVIIMDNALYHSYLDPDSRVPNTSSNKSEISAWLEKSIVQYIIDELASANGHEILRTPPYHCEPNPIEMVWSYLKGYVARHNSTCKKKGIIKLLEEAKSHIDAQRWAKFETHVERKFEEKFRKLDGIRDEDVDPVVIDITDDDSQDSQRTITFMFSEGRRLGMTLKVTMTLRTVSLIPSMMLMRFCAIPVVALNHPSLFKRTSIYPGFSVMFVISGYTTGIHNLLLRRMSVFGASTFLTTGTSANHLFRRLKRWNSDVFLSCQ